MRGRRSPCAARSPTCIGGTSGNSCETYVPEPCRASRYPSLAFLPQFADPAAGSLAPQLLLLGAIVTITAIPCDAFVALVAGAAARTMARQPLYRRLQNWLSGSVLIGLGAYVATSERP
jgi:hypothetical protein